MRRHPSRQAFTLIELMITVGIVGVLSAIAIPSFSTMIRRSKTAETSANLNALFKSAASYYASERSQQGSTATVAGHCTVDDGGPAPMPPKRVKQRFPGGGSFDELGFTIGDPIFYAYGVATKGGVSSCDNLPNATDLYTFYAHGDLDGDGIMSTFEMAAGSEGANLLYHSIGFYIDNETE